MRLQRRHSKHRSGSALAEAAICVPVLLTFALAIVELTNFVFVKQTVTAAAYECVRVAISRTNTPEEARDRAEEVLAARGITNATITLDPSDTEDVETGFPIEATVVCSSAENSLLLQRFTQGLNVTGRVNMVKE